MLETQKDGYFTTNDFIPQVETAIDIFERVHPDTKSIFLFDNAPSNCKVADDALNVEMIFYPGGKQPKM